MLPGTSLSDSILQPLTTAAGVKDGTSQASFTRIIKSWSVVLGSCVLQSCPRGRKIRWTGKIPGVKVEFETVELKKQRETAQTIALMHSGNNYLARDMSFVSSVIAESTRILRSLAASLDRLDGERCRLSLRMLSRYLAGKQI